MEPRLWELIMPHKPIIPQGTKLAASGHYYSLSKIAQFNRSAINGFFAQVTGVFGFNHTCFVRFSFGSLTRLAFDQSRSA